MSDKTPNIPLLRKAVEWAEAEAAKPPVESEWDQSDWITQGKSRAMKLAARGYGYGATKMERAMSIEPECGTAYCIAGYVGHLYGYDFGDSVNTWVPVDPADIAEFAQEKLGITAAEGGWLFDANNDIEDIRRIAETIAGERL